MVNSNKRLKTYSNYYIVVWYIIVPSTVLLIICLLSIGVGGALTEKNVKENNNVDLLEVFDELVRDSNVERVSLYFSDGYYSFEIEIQNKGINSETSFYATTSKKFMRKLSVFLDEVN